MVIRWAWFSLLGCVMWIGFGGSAALDPPYMGYMARVRRVDQATADPQVNHKIEQVNP